MAKTKAEKKFVTMLNTLCEGEVFAWKDDDENPVIYDTAEEAWKEIADSMITCLQQFIDGERRLEDTDFETEDYVVPCDFDGKTIVLEDGTVYKMKKKAKR